MHIKKKLDVFKILLSGVNLIEASAGTGKTFTIVLLYLRCLLGIRKKNPKTLLIHEILVLTFTNKAKEELYIRIKTGIEKLYLAFINKTSTDPICQLFLNKIENVNEAIILLKKAKNNIHNASIYTIHSFCKNILQSNNFYINDIFQDKIIENEDHLYLKNTQDFWRLHLYNLPENIIKIILKYYTDPQDLLKAIKPFIQMNIIGIHKKIIKKEDLIFLHQKNINTINDFKKKWLINHHTILKTLHTIKINKRIYNKFNLSRWINHITKWSDSKTQDYQIPMSLKYFTPENIKHNTINHITLEHIIFKKTEKILKHNFSLKKIIMLYAIQKIQKLLKKEKRTQKLLGFNDLLSTVLKMLKKEKKLQVLIRNTYPIVFIDEFQDTNIEQYQIFNILYKDKKKVALFLIGDPKQAIYSFRGADIFSYLYIKSQIKKQYYLDTNWRSSLKMCNSINYLFAQNNNPFILKNILYTPIIAPNKNAKMKFIINGRSQKPIRFFLHPEKEVYLDEYQIWIAQQCAKEISYWLHSAHMDQAKIITSKAEKILSLNDIAILVKNKKEADIIKKELNQLHISSIYSSEKNSIFKTFDAQELLWILESILEPDNMQFLQKAIATHIFQKIFSREKNNTKQEYVIFEKLYKYHEIWKNIGIFHMIKFIILEYQGYATVKELNTHYIKNLNFLHIAEILQEKFRYLSKKVSLIRWFQKKILEKKEPAQHECIKHVQESEFINIITIHKSKGLEYPIVWIPFIADFNKSLLSIYHNKNTFKVVVDITKNQKTLKNADEERLAEDIRLLYVAITRSILHCCIGLSCLVKKKVQNRTHSDIHMSSIGYIIKNGYPMSYDDLLKTLTKLSSNNLIEVKNNTKYFIEPNYKKNIYVITQPLFLNQNNNNISYITSFTNLQKENNLLQQNQSQKLLDAFNVNIITKEHKKLTINNFPKGKNTGLMMHYILKHLHTLNKKENHWFSHVLEKYNFSLKWTQTLTSWIKNIINTPLDNKNMNLSNIKMTSCTKELHFLFPIKNTLHSLELNKIIQCFDTISISAPKLVFNPVKGICQGFIDLFFIWNKKYYILDYKSNWLGKNNTFYNQKNIQHEMIKNRYDIQYQIYTIAIHKYLKQKIKNYHYHYDFGGVFYFFLRAIEDQNKNNGIFYTIPNYLLIKNILTLIT